MNVFEPLFWTGCAYVLVRLADGASPRLWLLFGLLAGLGLLNKHSTAFFGLAALRRAPPLADAPRARDAVALGRRGRRAPRLPPEPPLAGGERLPDARGPPQRRAHREERRPRPRRVRPAQQVLQQGPHLLPALARRPRLAPPRPQRPLPRARERVRRLLRPDVRDEGEGLLPDADLPDRSSRPGPSASTSCLERRRRLAGRALAAGRGRGLRGPPHRARRAARPADPRPARAFVAYTRRLGFEPPKTEVAHGGPLPQIFGDQFGWPELVADVARVWNGLTPEERARAAIFANNYGEAGAINLFGPAHGLPRAISAHQNHFFWGPRGFRGDVLVVLQDDRESLERALRLGRGGRRGTSTRGGWPRRTAPIWVCRGLKTPLPELWPRLKHWN